MATRSQKIKVGIFLLACAIFLVVILVIISGMQRFPTDTYYVDFHESVTGLDKGGEVRYNGVLVGQVEDVSIGVGGSVRVTLKIRRDKLREVRKGMVAKLAMRGITGIAYVDISRGATGKILPPGSKIPSEPSFISNVTSNFPDILEGLKEILVKTNKALGEPEDKFQQNLDSLFEQIADATNGLTNFVNEATTQTRMVSKRLTRLIDNLNSSSIVTGKRIDEILAAMNNTLGKVDSRISELDLKTALEKMNRLTDELTSTTATLDSLLNTTDKEISNVEYHMRRTLKQLHSTMSAAQELIESIERDPSSLIYGRRPSE